jgi:hypothetical protein
MLRTSFDVAGAVERMKLKLLDKLRLELTEMVQANGWDLLWDVGVDWAWSGLFIRFAPDAQYRVGFQFGKPGLNNLVFGLAKVAKHHPDCRSVDSDLSEALREAFPGPTKREDWYQWQRKASPSDSILPVVPDWERASDPWVEIKSGRMAQHIIRATESIYSALPSSSPP